MQAETIKRETERARERERQRQRERERERQRKGKKGMCGVSERERERRVKFQRLEKKRKTSMVRSFRSKCGTMRDKKRKLRDLQVSYALGCVWDWNPSR